MIQPVARCVNFTINLFITLLSCKMSLRSLKFSSELIMIKKKKVFETYFFWCWGGVYVVCRCFLLFTIPSTMCLSMLKFVTFCEKSTQYLQWILNLCSSSGIYKLLFWQTKSMLKLVCSQIILLQLG